MKTVLKDRIGLIRCVYLSLFFAYALLREVIFVQKFISSSALIYGLFGFGVLLILFDLLLDRKHVLGSFVPLMAVFLFISLLSVLMNASFAFVSNLKALGWMLLFFYLIYPAGARNDVSERNCVFSASVAVSSVLALFSVPMYFFHVDYGYRNENVFGEVSNQGFSGEFSRLWGLFGDPNTAAIYMVVALLMAGYLFLKCRGALCRVLTVVASVPMILYIALSGSRTAFVSLCVSCGWLVFCHFFYKKRNQSKRFLISFLSAIVALLLCLSAVIALRFSLPFVKKGLVLSFETEKIQVLHSFYNYLYREGEVEVESNFDPLRDDWKKTFVSLDRKDVLEKGDLSNGRMEIWRDSFRMFLQSPLIGTSPRGASDYGNVHLPDNLISEKGVACHNFFLEILVGTGILGFGVAFLYLLKAAGKILSFATKGKTDETFVVLSAVALCLVCGGMFLSDLFFILSFGGASFWYALGALSVFTSQRKSVKSTDQKRVLIYGPKDPVGGVEKIVFEYVRAICSRHDEVSFDLLQYGSDFSMEKNYNALGCRVIYLPSRKNYFLYKKSLNRVFRDTDYSAVWGNYSGLTNLDLLSFAKHYGVPVRIAHSHGSRLYWGSRMMKYVVHLLHYFNKWFRLEQLATDFWACSDLAGEFMFPKSVHSQIVRIPNAVDTDLFAPSEENRRDVRREFAISENAVVIGHVARMCYVKNQPFLLKVVSEAVKMNPCVQLLFVGEGEMQDELDELVDQLALNDRVIFTGNRNDVFRLLSAMDVFVLTSFSEGLSVSAVEAQAIGLNCVVPTTVSKETDLAGAVKFIPLEAGAKTWAEAVLNVAKKPSSEQAAAVARGEFSLHTSADRLYRRFLDLGA